MFVVGNSDLIALAVLAKHPVIRAVIGYFDNLINKIFCLSFASARVLFAKVAVRTKPPHDCRNIWHFVGPTNLS